MSGEPATKYAADELTDLALKAATALKGTPRNTTPLVQFFEHPELQRRALQICCAIHSRYPNAEYPEPLDLRQAMFTEVCQRIETFRGDSKVLTWMFSIAENLSKNQVRRDARRAGLWQQHSDVSETSGDINREQLWELARNILSEDEWEIFRLRLMGCKLAEISQTTGLSKSTVHRQLDRIITKIVQQVRR